MCLKGKECQTGIVCLLVERARQRVGHERPVGHGVDVLHQVMKDIAVWASETQSQLLID